MPRPRKTLVLLGLLGLFGGIGWWQHRPLLAWYYVKQLTQASDETQGVCVNRVIFVDDAAIPSLIDALETADDKSAANLESAFIGLLGAWGPDDARSERLLKQLEARLNSKATTLRLVARLFEVGHGDSWLARSRVWALEGVRSKDFNVRAAAVHIVLHSPLRKEATVLAAIVPLLQDSAASVRKTALVALGPARDLVPDDDLILFLHDADIAVQNLCELALRRRGLSDADIRLARLISDERPEARLQVVQYLLQAEDIDPGVWLERLCQDPAPAVRAAAIRAAVAQSLTDMRPRLLEMAQTDASPTVRQLAGYYLYRARPSADNE